MDNIFKYYCFDWLAMFCSMLGMYLIGHKYKGGFILMLFGSLFWICFSYLTSSVGCFFSSFLNGVLACSAYRNWNKEQQLEKAMNHARQSFDPMAVDGKITISEQEVE